MSGDPFDPHEWREYQLGGNQVCKEADPLIDRDRLSNKLYLKVADLAALEGDYYKSIEHYEKVARSSISNQLMKWSVKDYFLKAGICHLASGVRLPASPPLPPYPHAR